mgnify:CR=1 FL=1
MHKDFINVIGIKDISRKDIFNKDFEEWSNFDGWESVVIKQWIFVRVLDINTGKKIDIK